MIELPRPARLQGAAFYVKILIIIFLRIMALRAVQEAAYMRMVDLIIDKREGKTHTREEINYIIREYTAGNIPDYQMSAWLMAVCWQGMTEREVSELTSAMMHSGDVVDLSDLPGIKVDKHSTGGVGDTTTLVIAPLVAACGGTVAKMSGRGLGHTGGTLDKLESVPGVCIEKNIDEFKDIVRRIGLSCTPSGTLPERWRASR